MADPAAPVLAIDIGGTKLAAAVITAEGRIASRDSVPTAAGGTAEKLFDDLVAVVGRARRAALDDHDLSPDACGVGCGGPMERGGEAVSPLNIPAWRDFPLRSRLESALGLPTFVDNDAKALALGEGRFGAARGQADFIAMVVSTGIGGGIVLDGRLLDGRRGNAGHVGHLIVEPDGRPCRCGSRGCLEAEASGTAIAAITGRSPAEADAATIERAGLLVGRAIGMVAVLLDLPLALVAGSVALGFGEPFFTAAQREIDRVARLDYARGCRVAPAGLGAAGPLVGAAAVGLLHRRGASGPAQ